MVTDTERNKIFNNNYEIAICFYCLLKSHLGDLGLLLIRDTFSIKLSIYCCHRSLIVYCLVSGDPQRL